MYYIEHSSYRSDNLVMHHRNCLLFTDCREGYIGVNCTVGCRYPSYGKQCQYACNCSKEDCNKFTGCVMREIHEYGVYTADIVNHKFLNTSQLTVYICIYISNSPSISVKHTLIRSY